MLERIKRIPRNYKLLIVSILVLTTIILIGFKTNFPKLILDKINKPLLEERERLKQTNESLRNQIIIDSINSSMELEESIKEGEYYKKQYQSARKLNREYEKAFESYRIGDYPNNFRLFSRFVTSRDTLSIDRFDIDNQP